MKMKKFGVVGAGMMGAEIALCFAQAGYETVLGDIKLEFAENGKKRLDGMLAKRVAKGKMTEEEKTAAMNNIKVTCTADSVADYADCDLIVEAALEVFEIKSDIFKRLDEVCKESTIIASNPSSISITKLSTAVSAARAPRFIGLHYNSPASIMKLVEVIPAVNTSAETTEACKEILKKIGKESRFVDGLRYTDEETMEVVQQVLCGKVNKDLVATLNRMGGRALGLCGMDAGLFQARKLSERYGLVGEITQVDPSIVEDALADGYIPVVSTVAQGVDGETAYNINADTAAAKLAVALHAEKLILLTDVRGLLRDPKNEETLIHVVELPEVPGLVKDGIIQGGMIPKVDCCVEAVRSGVERTHILDGRIPHSILIEMLSDEGIGTMLL